MSMSGVSTVAILTRKGIFYPVDCGSKLTGEYEAVNALLQARDVHDLYKVALHCAQLLRVSYTHVLWVLALQCMSIHSLSGLAAFLHDWTHVLLSARVHQTGMPSSNLWYVLPSKFEESKTHHTITCFSALDVSCTTTRPERST